MTPRTPGSYWDEGLPDFDATYNMSELRPGWEPGTRVVVADLFRLDQPVEVAPRGALRRAVESWRAVGYEPFVGIELEAYMYEPDGAGGWQPIDTPGAFVYGTGASVDPHGLIDEIWEACHEAGIPLESVNSEYDPGQFEFTLRYSDALRAADEAFLFKLLAREVAHRCGLMLTFMGKPMTDRGGSGLHFNLSWNNASGENVVNDSTAPDGLSAVARHAVAGLIDHHQALAAICAPTVNAYKRLRPSSMSGYWANWGYDHRGATVRIPHERGTGARLEHRLSDGAAPIHSALAAVLQAARLGLTHESPLGLAESGNGLDTIDAKIGAPRNLSDALDALEADHELVEAIGTQMVAQHIAVKRTEWQHFCAATTDWELREYLPFV